MSFEFPSKEPPKETLSMCCGIHSSADTEWGNKLPNAIAEQAMTLKAFRSWLKFRLL
jgi:hypothetical protein